MEISFDFSDFQKNLRLLIESHGLTVKGLAAEVSISHVTLSRYLNGHREPELKYVITLAQYSRSLSTGSSASPTTAMRSCQRSPWNSSRFSTRHPQMTVGLSRLYSANTERKTDLCPSARRRVAPPSSPLMVRR